MNRISKERWGIIEPIVEQLLDHFPEHTWKTRLSNKGHFARFINRCLGKGEPLAIEAMFTPSNIEHYANQACKDYTASTIKNVSFSLKAIIRKHGLAEIGVIIPSPRGESTSLSEPYTAADIVNILDWVDGGTSPYMKESPALVVACGLGSRSFSAGDGFSDMGSG